MLSHAAHYRSKEGTRLQKLPGDGERLGSPGSGVGKVTARLASSPALLTVGQTRAGAGRASLVPGGWLALLLVLVVLCSSPSKSESNSLFSRLMRVSRQRSPSAPRRWLVVQAAASQAAQSTLDLAAANYLWHLNRRTSSPPFPLLRLFWTWACWGFLTARPQWFSVPPVPVLSPSPFFDFS